MAKLRNVKNQMKAKFWMRYNHNYAGAALVCPVCKTIWKEGPTFEMENYIQTFNFSRRCNCGAYDWMIFEGDYF